MTRTKHQLSSHAVGRKSSGGSVPLQPVSTKVHSSPQRGAAQKPPVKLTPPKK